MLWMLGSCLVAGALAWILWGLAAAVVLAVGVVLVVVGVIADVAA